MIRSVICVPDDYTQLSCTQIADEYQFAILIEPCLVSTYTATTTVTQITYDIGGATMSDGQYAFSQNPSCGYPETVTVSNLPAFAIHNQPSRDFTIPQNNDSSLQGEYVVTLRSEICVPDDYTNASCTTMAAQYDFKIIVTGCIVDTYTATKLVGDIRYNIGSAGLSNVGNYIFAEDPVCNLEETVTLTNLPTFITQNELTSDFTLPQTTSLSLIGSYVVTIRSEIEVPDLSA